MKTTYKTLLASMLFFSAGAEAAVHTCGAYTVTQGMKETSSGYPMQYLNVSKAGKNVLSFNDSGLGMQWCQDVTGDRIPELLLTERAGPSGTYRLFSMGATPQLIRQGALYGDGFDLTPVQLDGRGAKELIMSAQWMYEKYADTYGLDDFRIRFPEVLQWNGRQYVRANRKFPAVVQKRTQILSPQSRADVMSVMLGLFQRGLGRDVDTFLANLRNPELTQWGQDMEDTLRNEARQFDLQDWPLQAGFSPRTEVEGVVGAFTAKGREEFLALVTSKDPAPLAKAGEPALLLFSQTPEGKVTARRLKTPELKGPVSTLHWVEKADHVLIGSTVYEVQNNQLMPSKDSVMTQVSQFFTALTVAAEGKGTARQQARQAVQNLMSKQVGMGSLFSPLNWEFLAIRRLDFFGVPDSSTYPVSAQVEFQMGGQLQRARISLMIDRIDGKWQITRWYLV